MASLFPYDNVRPEQDEMVKDVFAAASSGKCLIAHAPTGLGKTAASLSPALEYALNNGKTVFFLTSRHTQHHTAIETLKLIRQKHKMNFSVIDLLGKKHMCARGEAKSLFTRQFHEYCSSLRENDSCSFYTNFRKGYEPSPASKSVIAEISSQPTHAEDAVEVAKKHGVCPYEVCAIASRNTAVIIADYFSIFSPAVRENFLKRNSKSLADSIIIVDEAHNLPGRMREMLTERISTIVIERAMKEAEKWAEPAIEEFLSTLQRLLGSLASESPERTLEKEQLLKPLGDVNKAIERMTVVAGSVRETEQQSFIGSVADFLSAWQRGDDGYARILTGRQGYNGIVITVSYQCLDPSIETKKVIEEAHSVILMSGTLTPTFMYKDILGFPEDAMQREYSNPMPAENRLSLVVTGVTTKFSSRTPEEYKKIASACAEALNSIPGNAAIFFPSYLIMEKVHVHLHEKVAKAVFKEHPNLSKEEKQGILSEFKRSCLTGGLLLAVIGGSFSEGIDLPGEFLNGVIVVGLPLAQPDLYTKALIRYYDARYKKGWDYGYVFPAFTKALQSAGRCIRSETDRGVVLFLDERYTWDRYYRCFPKELAPKTTRFFAKAIEEFFKKKL